MTLPRIARIGVVSGLCLLVPIAAFATPINLDFSSGTFFDRPTGSGVDLYMQDDFTVEIENVTHNTNMAACPGRWCFDNQYTTPQETTLITHDLGLSFDLVSVQVIAVAQGLQFSADGGAFLAVNSVGTVNFGPEFRDVSIVRVTVPCSGQYNSCYVTIDNIMVQPVPEPSIASLLAGGLLSLAMLRRRGGFQLEIRGPRG